MCFLPFFLVTLAASDQNIFGQGKRTPLICQGKSRKKRGGMFDEGYDMMLSLLNVLAVVLFFCFLYQTDVYVFVLICYE